MRKTDIVVLLSVPYTTIVAMPMRHAYEDMVGLHLTAYLWEKGN